MKLFRQNLNGKAENWFKFILRRRNYYLIKFEDIKEVFERFFSPLEDKNIVSYERLKSCK
jgi:hypothetical protein